jgi:hypothetical protein
LIQTISETTRRNYCSTNSKNCGVCGAATATGSGGQADAGVGVAA